MKTRPMAILITMSLAVLLAAPASGAEERPVKPGIGEGNRGSLEDDMAIFGDMASLDRNDRVGLQRSDYLLRDFSPAWRDLVASVPVYAAWDDHDYCNNDASGINARFTAADRSAARTMWMRNWNN